MTCRQATYSGNPASSPKDEVRFWLGDINMARALWGDAEIEFMVGKTPNTRMAASHLLEIKANEFGRKADIRVGDVSKAYSKAAESMRKFAEDLKKDALRAARPFFGGLSKSGKKALRDDTDATQPQFYIGQTDNPFAVQMSEDINALYSRTGMP